MVNKSTMLLVIGLIISASLHVCSQGFSPQTQSRLQQVLNDFQNDATNPVVGGISAAIKVDGLASWQGVSGYLSRNIDGSNNLLPGGIAFTTQTPSRLYSITKTFTAPLVLQLVNEGLLSLDDPISMYLPVSIINPSLNSSVTIRQLLNHESGYSDWEENTNLQIAIAFDPTKTWTPYELIAFTDQLSAPGTVRRYSHNNYVFLGAIVELVTSKPVQVHFRERFFTPLGFTSFYLGGREPHGTRPPLALPHDNIAAFNPIFYYTGQPTYPNTITNISGFPFTAITSLAFSGGGLIANAGEVADWGNALFNGRATTKAVLDQMLNSISPVADANGNKLGMGIKAIDKISGAYDFFGHNGSAPGYQTGMWYNPDRKMTIVVLSNFAGINSYEVAEKLFEALPEFTCGNDNKKEKKIVLCHNKNTICVDRSAAKTFMMKGAYLGGCETNSNRDGINLPMAVMKPAELLVYPNPAKSIIQIKLTLAEPGNATLLIYDISGKLVSTAFNGQLEGRQAKVLTYDASKLAPGAYIVKLTTSKQTVQQQIFISQ